MEAHSGSEIILEARKQISGKTPERVSLGMEEMNLSVIDRFDTIIVHLSGPCAWFSRYDGNGQGRYGYRWQDCTLKYDCKMDITVKVPANTNLLLSTINDGDIEVEGVRGSLNVNNINGAIS